MRSEEEGAEGKKKESVSELLLPRLSPRTKQLLTRRMKLDELVMNRDDKSWMTLKKVGV